MLAEIILPRVASSYVVERRYLTRFRLVNLHGTGNAIIDNDPCGRQVTAVLKMNGDTNRFPDFKREQLHKLSIFESEINVS